MRNGGGKEKGGNFEREICKKLSLWISYNERDDIFWRSAMSGGRATVGLKKGIIRNTQVGDITAIDPLGNKLTDKYIIECKYYKNIHVESLLFGKPKNNSILEFWTKLYEQSEKLNKQMMLIIKQNNSATLLGLTHDSNLQKILNYEYKIKPKVIFFSLYPCPVCYLYDFELILTALDPVVLEKEHDKIY